VKIRAKKSRQNKSDNRRDFDIRVFVDDGNETMISFANSGIEDIEFRSGDMAVFSYFKGKLKIAQNLTIGQYSPFPVLSAFLRAGCLAPTLMRQEFFAVGEITTWMTLHTVDF
jgi:hypothetical protein